jgi:4-amino-4-deoxy-L-arabinose transferase-like glycosyltransferase
VRQNAALAILLACALVPRLATLRSRGEAQAPPHGETDEQVFLTLVAQVRAHPLGYTLRGTPLLAKLDSHNYDKPIFFHPPAFVYLCAALGAAGIPVPLVPVVLDLATIALAYVLALRLYGTREAIWSAFLLAACPVTWFVSQHVWIDSMLVFAVALAMVAADWAGRKGTPLAYAAAGAAVALAFLSKTTGALALPAAAALAWRADPAPFAPRKLIAAATAALLPCLAWVAILRVVNGQWLPSAFPTPEMMQRYPFVASIVARPWHYYASSLLLFAPVFAFSLLRLRARDRRDAGPALCAAAFFVALTVFGLLRGGYQTRYVAPGYFGLALLAGAAIVELPAAGAVAAAALVAYGTVGAAEYAVFHTPRFADLRSSAAEQFAALFR